MEKKTMEKLNHINILGDFYKQPKNKISLVDVPAMNFIMIDGTGDPNNNPSYSDAVGALYAVAYNLKFMVKKGPLEIDYKVMPLEGLWWAEDMAGFSLETRDNWQWTMMIMQPEQISVDMFSEAIENVKTKKNPPRLKDLRFESYAEGLSMQIFHRGPYGAGEVETIERLHGHIASEGYQLRGKHHEIYFNSPLRTAPENLKTIIRQPVHSN